MPRCTAFGCTNQAEKVVAMYGLKWKLCAVHFKADQFQLMRSNRGKMRLKAFQRTPHETPLTMEDHTYAQNSAIMQVENEELEEDEATVLQAEVEVEVDVDVEFPVKRKRGRPVKKKKLGRPPKPTPPQVDPAPVTMTVKRKRGRPPKHTPPPKPASLDKTGGASSRHNDSTPGEVGPGDVEFPVKRKRGRPVKKKKLGRPPKPTPLQVDPAPVTMTVKRKRGRPPKHTPPPKPASLDKTGAASSRHNLPQLSMPEAPQIKEEEDLWSCQGAEQLQRLQSDTRNSIFTSPTVKTHCEAMDLSQLHFLERTQPMENRERDSLYKRHEIMEVKIKTESDEEDYGAPEPASDSQPPSVTPDCPTAQSLEEEKGGLMPELASSCARRLPTRDLTSGNESRSPLSPWTRPITSSCSGSESEESGEAKSKTVEKRLRCEECDKDFRFKSVFETHRRTHTKEKPFKCEECDRAFSRRYYLFVHRRTHTGEKPYKCAECDRAFATTSSLVRHKRTHTGKKSYNCAECDGAFTSNSNLVEHERTHAGEKPLIHTGEKPYTVVINTIVINFQPSCTKLSEIK